MTDWPNLKCARCALSAEAVWVGEWGRGCGSRLCGPAVFRPLERAVVPPWRARGLPRLPQTLPTPPAAVPWHWDRSLRKQPPCPGMGAGPFCPVLLSPWFSKPPRLCRGTYLTAALSVLRNFPVQCSGWSLQSPVRQVTVTSIPLRR